MLRVSEPENRCPLFLETLLAQRYQWLERRRQGRNKKGHPMRTALPEYFDLEGRGRRVLAEITPALHYKPRTIFERRNLIRHWITSFTLVEHADDGALIFSVCPECRARS
ncbi:hypothetical protein WH91_12405 [Devosia psychrophila]|uniref:Uncharacterized protein n=2 Tax=Devosia psychrophila TaxID=728005 RepID=A0ABR5DX84_9HYPH|nr:hypothetical protein WH91_12405 [Devosia psychrophila]